MSTTAGPANAPSAGRFVIVPNRRIRLDRNYNIMRPLSFRSDELRSLLLRSKIATLDELKQALGTSVDVTVFRKLKPLDYLTSYSHRGRYYTLREIARFDDQGLWSQADVWFSRFGTLLATAETFVNRSPRGYFADELARALHVEVQDCTASTRPATPGYPPDRFRFVSIHGHRSHHPARATSYAPQRGSRSHGGGCLRAGGLRKKN